jgi:hypothetical protein
VLFLEEVQSDWHQSGRKKGYKQTGLEQKNFVTWLKDNGKSIPTEEMESQFKSRQGEEIEAWQKEQDAAWANIFAAPDAPFKKTWAMLSMKRMIRYAAENGFDSVAWTPGEVHTNRWGTERIEWSRQADGSFLIDAKSQHGEIDLEREDEDETINRVSSQENLKNAIQPVLTEGQDASALSKKLWNKMQAEPTGASMPRKEGFEGFYDQILPSEVNKMFNKAEWGRAKVGKSEVGWSIPITPQMRHKALYEGMPIYAAKNERKTKSKLDEFLAGMPDDLVKEAKESTDRIKAGGPSHDDMIRDAGSYAKGADATVHSVYLSAKKPLVVAMTGSDVESGTFSPENPDIRYQVANDRQEINDDLSNTSLSMLETIKSAVIPTKPNKSGEGDLNYFWDLVASTPQFFSKKIGAARRIFQSAQDKQDRMHAVLEHLDTHDGVKAVSVLDELKGTDKNQFKSVADYLIDSDKTGVGFNIEDKAGWWVVSDPKGKEIFREESSMSTDGIDIGEIKALDEMGRAESEFLRGKGFSDLQVSAVGNFRKTTNKVFDLFISNLRSLQKMALENGIDEPLIIDGVTIKEAIAQMGSLRGTYYPRIRERGNFVLIATKEGQPNELHTFTHRFGAIGVAKAKFEKNGYKVEIKPSETVGEDVFELEGNLIKTQQIVNSALSKMEKGEAADNDLMAMFTTALSEQIANVIRKRGARTHMTKRSPVYYAGYETDPSVALAQYTVSAAGAESKRIMTNEMMRALSGTDIEWKEFKAVMQFNGSYEDYVSDYRDANLEITKEFFDKHNSPDEIAENKQAIEDARALLKDETDKEAIEKLKETIKDLRGFEYGQYQKLVKSRMIDQGKQPNAFKWAKAYIEEMTRNTETADKVIGMIRSLAVVKYLSTRVFSSPFVNLMSLPTSGIATMKAAGIPYHETWSEIRRGIQDAGRYMLGKPLEGTAKEIFDVINKNGWDNPDFSSESLAKLRGKFGRAYDATIEKLMWTFSKSETINRCATISALYRGLKKLHPEMSVEELADKAKEFSDRAHGIYNKGNYPYLALGSNPAAQVAKMFYVFRTFAHTYYQNMARMGFDKEYGALAHMVLSPALVAGMGASVLTPVIKAMMKAFGSDDPEEELYQKIADEFGRGASRFARHGIAGALTGTSLKGSMAVGILDVPTTIADLTGAPGSALGDLYDGTKLLFRGDGMKGAEKIAPSGIGNIIRAYRESQQGVTNYGNAPIFYGKDQLRPTVFETIQRGLSFNPGRLAEISEKRWSEKQIQEKYRNRKSDIYAKVKAFYLQPVEKRSKDKYAPILMEIQKFNEDSKKYEWMPPITSESIKRYLKTNFRPSKRERMREEE